MQTAAPDYIQLRPLDQITERGPLTELCAGGAVARVQPA